MMTLHHVYNYKDLYIHVYCIKCCSEIISDWVAMPMWWIKTRICRVYRTHHMTTTLHHMTDHMTVAYFLSCVRSSLIWSFLEASIFLKLAY